MLVPIASPRTLDRLLRFVVLPLLAGVALGFALLWLHSGSANGKGAAVPAPVSSFSDAVARAAPAVVNIFSRRSEYPLCELPRYRLLCERLYRSQGAQGSLGSGVVMRSDGYILTNYHVVAAGGDILVAFNNGSQAQADLVGADTETDLAVLKVASDPDAVFPAIERGAAEAARVGDFVLAIGNPFGIGQGVSLGIVSAKGRYAVRSPYDDFVQTDAAINPGNSGGALVDAQGRLLGINTFIYSRSGGSDGVGLAIPVERAVAVLDEIAEHGRVLRGYLGASLIGPRDEAEGLGVVRVYFGTPAHAAGLRPGDLLLSVNGEPARTVRDVTRRIRDTEPGDELSLRILRGGAVRLLRATAGLHPAGG